MKHTNFYNIKLIKGFDKNKIPFSAFILLSDEENILSNNIDLTKYNIIYKTIGHNPDPKITELIFKYAQDFFLHPF
jgi:hypothetical protein